VVDKDVPQHCLYLRGNIVTKKPSV
jgi:hypothetical protein